MSHKTGKFSIVNLGEFTDWQIYLAVIQIWIKQGLLQSKNFSLGVRDVQRSNALILMDCSSFTDQWLAYPHQIGEMKEDHASGNYPPLP